MAPRPSNRATHPSAAILVAVAAACGSNVDVVPSAASAGAGGAGAGVTTGGETVAATSGSSDAATGPNASSSSSSSGAGGTGGGPPICDPMPDEDLDADGYSLAGGDCNDCDPLVHPGGVETVGADPPMDDDCDGAIDNLPCDQGFALDDPSPIDAARALDLCKDSAGPGDWGLVSATWVMADGAPPPVGGIELANFHLGHGLLAGFGPNVSPRAGQRLLALSNGTARQPTDPGFLPGLNKQYAGGQPQGFPKDVPACPGVQTGAPHDPTGLEVVLRVPPGATGLSFDFDFYTQEWPNYVCSNWEDTFVALLAPTPPNQPDGSIAFDGVGGPISVSTPMIDVCTCMMGPPCTVGGPGGPIYACSLGPSQLEGNDFGAATGWLSTTAPATPGDEIVLRWAVYDSNDGNTDTATLIDRWRWLTAPGVVVSTQIAP